MKGPVYLQRTRTNPGGLVPIYAIQRYRIVVAMYRDPIKNPDFEPFAESIHLGYGECRWCGPGRMYREIGGTHEHFKPVGILEIHITRRALGIRDRWRCWLCGDSIDQNLPHPHPMSASIDHVTPKAKGGTDTEANIRIAHLICNERKGARAMAHGPVPAHA